MGTQFPGPAGPVNKRFWISRIPHPANRIVCLCAVCPCVALAPTVCNQSVSKAYFSAVGFRGQEEKRVFWDRHFGKR